MNTGAHGRTDTLPPIGDAQLGTSDANNLVNMVFARRQGIINALARPLAIAASCRRIVTWGEDTEVPDDVKTVVNKIRLAVETQVANHLKEPAQVTIDPVETGEYADWYWCGPPSAAAEVPITSPVVDPMSNQPVADPMDPTGQTPAMQTSFGLDPIYLGYVDPATGQVQPPAPLPRQLVKYLQQLAQIDEIDPQHICRLNDEYTAKTVQKDFDQDWRICGGDKWLRSRVYANTVEGWGLPYYEYDIRTQKHLLRRNSIEQTYIDQSCEDIDDATEAGIDLYLDLDEAIARYPEQREAIIASNDTAGSLFPPQTQGTVPVQFREEFKRPMLRKIVWWICNQPVGVAAALEAGLVQQVDVVEYGDEGLAETGAATNEQAGGGAAGPLVAGQNLAVTGMGSAGELSEESGQDGNSGSNLGSNGALLPPTRIAFILPDTGAEVTPESPDWPTALRQITIVGNELVEDTICAFPDIPLGHLRNTLVVGRPWGIGEPFHTKLLQDAYSKITDDAVEHVHRAAHPAREMHAGLKEHMEQEYGKAHVTAGSIIGVPAEYWNPQTPFIRTIEQPVFPVSSIQIRQLIGEDFNQIAGQNDVMTGKTPTPDASGRMVAALQAAAVEPLNFKAQEITYLMERIAGLMLYSILHFKPRADIAKTVSVPEPLLELVLQRARDRHPNVKVTISTGAGAVLDRKRQMYLQLNQAVDPATKMPLLSGQTAREAWSQDNATENRRNAQAVREAATAMAPLMQQQAEQEQGGDGEKKGKSGSNNGEPSSNGNGRFH